MIMSTPCELCRGVLWYDAKRRMKRTNCLEDVFLQERLRASPQSCLHMVIFLNMPQQCFGPAPLTVCVVPSFSTPSLLAGMPALNCTLADILMCAALKMVLMWDVPQPKLLSCDAESAMARTWMNNWRYRMRKTAHWPEFSVCGCVLLLCLDGFWFLSGILGHVAANVFTVSGQFYPILCF